MSAAEWLGVALLGGVGAVARVGVDGLTGRALGRRINGPGSRPAVGTFVVNVSGAGLVGLLSGLALSGTAALLLGTVLLGAYTTFSTWMLQTGLLLAGRRRRAGALNLLASLLVGLGALALGHLIGRAL